MRHVNPKILVLTLGAMLGLTACGPKAFTKGEYDDPNRVELLDDKYNEADMQQMSDTIVKAIVACPEVSADKRPVVIVDQVKNNTEEHIDMQSLTDKIRTADQDPPGKVRRYGRARKTRRRIPL